MDDFAAFEVFGQRRATVLVPLSRWLVGGTRRRWLAAFAAATEAVLQGRVEFTLQLGVLGPQPGDLREQLTDHRLERGDITWQRRVGIGSRGVHPPILASGPAQR